MLAATDSTRVLTAGESQQGRSPDRVKNNLSDAANHLPDTVEHWGVGLDDILHRVMDLETPGSDQRWSELYLCDLCEEIVARFHQPLKAELPRIGLLLLRVAEGDDDKHPELPRILEIYSLFSGELRHRLTEEEEVVFPMIKQLEENPELCDELLEIVAKQEFESASAARLLDYMHELTHDFCPPDDACGAYRAVLDALQVLELFLQEHMAIRNNVLFPHVFQMKAVAV